MSKTITILGINGHIGHEAAKAFVAAGWEVTGFGRENRHPVAGVRFGQGDAANVADIRRAIGDSEVVLQGLHPLYHQWDKGRAEALSARVVEAMGTTGKTLLFPGTIYNYAAADRVIRPDAPQHPETPRGAIRVRTEVAFAAAAQRGDIQVLILRAGDFFGAAHGGDWFDQAILREAGKGKFASLGKPGTAHAWAYLPDLARAFEKLAWHRKELGAFERFHFEGNFVTPEQMTAAALAAAPRPLKVSRFPWLILSVMGVTNPMMREIAKMGYLWQNPMQLKDERLAKILGPDFGTRFEDAVAATVQPFFEDKAVAA